MPKPKVKPISDALANIEMAAGTVGTKYARGIETGRPWQPAAASDAAEDLYAAATQEAISVKRRQKVLQSMSEEDWKGPARQRGASNIGPAMRAAKEKWRKNTQPYLEAIANADMAERTNDPRANVEGRLMPIIDALVAKKKEMKG